MKRGTLILLACICSSAVAADATVPTGAFGLEFTDNSNAVAYTVTGSGSSYKVTSAGDQTDFDAVVMDNTAKQKIWTKLGMAGTAYEKSACLVFDHSVLCNVPADQHASDAKLQQLKTDYFFYDPLADGIASAFPLK